MHPLTSIEGIHIHEPGVRRFPNAQLIGDFMPKIGTGLLIGDSGIGKTFTALAMATALATGRPFFDRWAVAEQDGDQRFNREECRAAVFVLSEGQVSFPKRIDASYFALQPQDRSRLAAQGFSGLPVFQMDGGGWHDEDTYQSHKERIVTLANKLRSMEENVSLELIVIDTVSGVFMAPAENDAAISQRTMDNMRKLSQETGAFVLGITHPAKGKAKSEPRGSVVFGATADLTITAQRIARSQTRAGIYISKNRDGPGQRKKTEYRLVDVQLPNGETSLFASALHNGASVETERELPQKRLCKYDRLVLEACELALISEPLTSLESNGQSCEVVSRSTVNELAVSEAIKDNTKMDTARRSVRRAIAKLVDSGHLGTTTQGSDDFVFCRGVE